MRESTRSWVIDLLLGGLIGGVVGAVIAVNVVIYSGIEGGYEASIPDVFRQSPVIGALTVGILAAGPVAGVLAARIRRRSRDKGNS